LSIVSSESTMLVERLGFPYASAASDWIVMGGPSRKASCSSPSSRPGTQPIQRPSSIKSGGRSIPLVSDPDQVSSLDSAAERARLQSHRRTGKRKQASAKCRYASLDVGAGAGVLGRLLDARPC
jgi:hypothetical protein